MAADVPEVPRTWAGWLLRWFAWTAVAAVVSFFGSSVLSLMIYGSALYQGSPSWEVLYWLLQGAVIGVSQWAFLRRWLAPAGSWMPATVGWWIPATMAEIALFWGIFFGGFSVVRWELPLPYPTSLVAEAVTSGAIAGVPQWFVLRLKVRGAAWWIPATAVGWGLGLVLGGEEAVVSGASGAMLLLQLYWTARAGGPGPRGRSIARSAVFALGLILIAASFLLVLAWPWLRTAMAPRPQVAPTPSPIVARAVAPTATPTTQPPTPTPRPATPTPPPPTPTPTLGPSLARNASFEEGAGDPTGWRQDFFIYRKQVWETAVAHSGTRSVSVSGSTCTPDGNPFTVRWMTTEPIAVGAGQRYQFSVWVRASDPFNLDKGSLSFNVAGTRFNVPPADAPPTQEWRLLQRIVEVPLGTTQASIEIGYATRQGQCDDANKVYFDDVEFRLVP